MNDRNNVTQLATARNDGAVLAQRLGIEASQLEFISKKYCNGAPPIEVEHFIRFAQAQGLDISAKQAYLIGRNDKNSDYDNGKSYTIQIAIDGYRAIAEATGEYDGQDAPAFEFNKQGQLISATVTVYRKQMSRGVAATAFFSEYTASNQMWSKMPRSQLAKCAEALALRKAFPKRLGGTYTGEEMQQAQIDDRSMPSLTNVTPENEPMTQLPTDSKKAEENAALEYKRDEYRKALIDTFNALGVDTKTKDEGGTRFVLNTVAATLQVDAPIRISGFSLEQLHQFLETYRADMARVKSNDNDAVLDICRYCSMPNGEHVSTCLLSDTFDEANKVNEDDGAK